MTMKPKAAIKITTAPHARHRCRASPWSARLLGQERHLLAMKRATRNRSVENPNVLRNNCMNDDSSNPKGPGSPTANYFGLTAEE